MMAIIMLLRLPFALSFGKIEKDRRKVTQAKCRTPHAEHSCDDRPLWGVYYESKLGKIIVMVFIFVNRRMKGTPFQRSAILCPALWGERCAALGAEFRIRGNLCAAKGAGAGEGEFFAAIFAKAGGRVIDRAAGTGDGVFRLPFSARLGDIFNGRCKFVPRFFHHGNPFVFIIAKDLTAKAEGKRGNADSEQRKADKQKEKQLRESVSGNRGTEEVDKSDHDAYQSDKESDGTENFDFLFGFFVFHTGFPFFPFYLYYKQFFSCCQEIFQNRFGVPCCVYALETKSFHSPLPFSFGIWYTVYEGQPGTYETE